MGNKNDSFKKKTSSVSIKKNSSTTNQQRNSNSTSTSTKQPPTPSNKDKDYLAEFKDEKVTGEYLKHVPLLAKLTDKERHKLGSALKEKVFEDGKMIITQGENGDAFYIICSGQVVVFATEGTAKKEFGRLSAGDYFGETALLSDAKRNASVQAIGAVKVWTLGRKEFQDLFGKEKLNVQFAKRLAISAEDQNDRLRAKTMQAAVNPANVSRDKTKQTTDFIMEAIQDNLLFSDMSYEQKLKIVEEMYRADVKKESTVIHQGERGDHLYVVESGDFQIFVNSVPVATRGRGTVFGELALMYNSPRAATVVALTDAVVWVVDRFTFRMIVTETRTKALSQYSLFLNKVQLLSPLAQYEREKIADAMEEVQFKNGDKIVVQGTDGDCMYVVYSGELVVSKVEANEKEEKIVGELKSGDYFGERSLIKNETRAATVTAKTPVVLLKLSEEAFRLLLGPLEEIMKKKIQNYDSKVDVHEEKKIEEEQEKKIQFKDLKVLGTLGKGSFGHVQLVKDTTTGKTYALKAVSKAQIVQTGQQGHIMSEKKVMMTLKHPFMIRLFATFKDQNRLLFLLEPSLGGELFSVLRARTLFDEDTARFFAASVVLAFEYMHSKNIIYRDLKPENLLLDQDGYLKVTDFGFAKELTSGRTYTLCGTPDYLAPEIVAGKGHGKGVDWWTLGVFIYEMLASYPPFYDEDPMKTYAKIMHGTITFPSHFSQEAINLIQKLLHHKPTKRLGVVKGGAKLIKQHPWFHGFDWDALLQKKLKAFIIPKIRSPEDLSNFDDYGDDSYRVETYQDDGTNWDADF